MSLAQGTIGAAVGALVGAAVWTGLSYFTGWNLGVLAPIVGGAAGFGMGMGNKGRGGMEAGLIAAALTVAGVMASRAMLGSLEYADFTREMADVTPEDARDRLGWEIMERFEEQGVEMTWEDDDSFPIEVEHKLQDTWDVLDEDKKTEMMAAMAAETRGEMEESAVAGTFIYFLFNMGILGWIFMAMSAGCAYRIASTEVPQKAHVPLIDGTSSTGAAAMASPSSSGPARPVNRPAPATVPPESGGSFFANLGRAPERDPLEGKLARPPVEKDAA